MSLPPIHIDRETFLKDHFALQPLPAVVRRVLESIQSGRANASEVATLLGADPGLVAQLLKLVNSAYYSLPSRITDVKHAVAYLGLAEVERSIVSAALMRYAGVAESPLFRHFWFHSFHTALVTRHLARGRVPLVDEGIQTAALLHDVGKLVYLKFFPQHFEALVQHCERHGISFVEAERALDLPSHLVFGSILCDRWLFPDAVKSACESHEIDHLERMSRAPQPSPDLELICVANLLSNLALEPFNDPTRAAIHAAITRSLGCDEQAFLLLMGEVYELRSRVEGFLQDL